MPRPLRRCRARRALLFLAASTLAAPAAAERLPIKVYTSADGLAHDRVKRIVRDSRGFLWLCTLMGLSRFDGERFETYRPDRGLPYFSINDLLEARDGTYWLATNGGGVVRFDHSAATGARFTAVRLSADSASNRVNALHQDPGGRIWLGTDGGLFSLAGAGEAWAARPAPAGEERLHVWAFADDGAGGLWIGTSSGLVHRSADGRTSRHLARANVWSVLLDAEGRVWAALDAGLTILMPASAEASTVPRAAVARADGTVALPVRAGESLAYGRAAGLAHDGARALLRAADGRIWVGSAGGLSCFEGGRFHGYGRRHGLADDWILSLAEDASGSLWLGTNSGGAMRMLRNGLVSYGMDDGLADTDDHVLGDRAGALHVATPGALALHAYAGGRFTGVRPPLRVPAAGKGGWGGAGNLAVLQDRAGEWWIPSGHDVYRFAPVARLEDLARARPRAVYSAADGLPDAIANAILEDSRGDVWVAFRTDRAGSLVRWQGPGRTLQTFSGADGVPAEVPWSLAEDGAGGVWAGFADGTLVRWHAGRFTTAPRADPWPSGTIRALHADRSGRLWVASWPGISRSQQAVLWRIDHPAADRPVCVPIPLHRHIGSGICLTEDLDGRIYVGCSLGVMRVTPDGAHTRYYTTADGLAANEVSTAFRDRAGVLWFGTTGGVSRLVPTPEQAAPAVGNVLISRLTVAGVPYPVSDLGAPSLSGLRLRPDQNTLGFEFLTLAFGQEAVRYQYRMEGAEASWSTATEDHAVRYAGLAPGAYRFLVRAVDADGQGGAPASVSFVVVPHLWRRPWFLALAGLALAAVAYAGYRVRLAHLLAVERVRTRIATDLHDDIGSSLSRVVILSEVARRQVDGHAEARTLLEDIGGTARTLIDATADIIWSIDPRRDAVGPLAARVREFAGGLFAGGSAIVRVHSDPEVERVHLDPGERRQLYLLLKEALNNAARHARCREVSVRLAVHGRTLVAEVRDDGCGFAEPAPGAEPPARGGHGLPSMRERAAALGGTLAVDSAPGRGTVLRVEVPI